MECPICFEEKHLIALKPCNHSFCMDCAYRICRQFDMKCSFCRQVVCKIEPHTQEVDKTIEVGNGKFAGITLKNDKHGVYVVRMKKEDEAYSVLKKGDVITHVNGIPAFNHQSVIQAINQATDHAINIELKLQGKHKCFIF